MTDLTMARYFPLIVVSIILVVFSFIFNVPGFHEYYTLRELQDVGHFVGFALFAIVLYPLVAARFSSLSPWSLIIGLWGALVVLGLSIELIQGLVGRDPSKRDLFLDSLGAMFGLLLYFAYCGRRWLLFPALILMTIAFYRLAITAYSEYHSYQAFPFIADFESTVPNPLLDDINKSTQFIQSDTPENTTRVAKIEIGERLWQGLGVHLSPHDWSDYTYLVVEVFAPVEGVPLTFELAWDLSQASYKQQTNLKKGWNTLRLPLAEIQSFANDKNSLRDMHSLEMAVNAERFGGQKSYLLIDNIRLE